MSLIPLQEENSRYTKEQYQAIHLEGSDILVSASAGSGKTRVLVDRILRKITDKDHPTNVTELLVVTFTELAAKEMKERLETEIKKKINEEIDIEMRRHLQRQLEELPSAQISTIDAFCRQVIQRFYYLIDLDPVYRLVNDETELQMLEETVWKALKEEILEEDGKYHADYYDDYVRASMNESDGRDSTEQRFDQTIFSLYRKARAHAEPIGWLGHLLAYYGSEEDYAKTPLYQEYVVPLVQQRLEDSVLAPLYHYLDTVPDWQVEGDKDGHAFEEIRQFILNQISFFEGIRDKLPTEKYENLYQEIQTLPDLTFPSLAKRFVSKSEAMTRKKELSKAYTVVKNEIKEQLPFSTFFAYDNKTTLLILQQSKTLAQSVIRLVQLFIQVMQDDMAEKQILDFAGIELYAYCILMHHNASNEARTYYQDRFTEIMIDEYQDVNDLQEAILKIISDPENNHFRFMVGDVKQSIYRFRYAAPELFIAKYQTYHSFLGTEERKQLSKENKIQLKENFRSRSEVLYFVNYVFDQLMDTRIGGIDYVKEAHLIYGNRDYAISANNFDAEVILVEHNEEWRESQPETAQQSSDALQANAIAQKIQQLVQGKFLIFDRELGEERPIAYRDIAILGSNRTHYLAVETVFSQYGIPIVQDKSQNYYQRTEIVTILDVLKLIDNPYQDIPLVGVLRSEIVGLTEPELAEIRLTDRETNYYDALKQSVKRDVLSKEIKIKVSNFIKQLEDWRDYAVTHRISELIWRIYLDTGYLDFMGGLDNGTQRQANLHGLYQRADQFEQSTFKGVFQYIRYIENMQKRENDIETPQIVTPTQNSVQLLTVHGSKGLEFPVVFYINLSKAINMQDLNESVIINEKIGLSVKVNDKLHAVTYSNPLREVVKEEERRLITGEEQRKLYVALTRAEQKLFLVGYVKDYEESLCHWEKAAQITTTTLSETQRLASSRTSLLDWIMPTLLRHPNFELWANAVVDVPIITPSETFKFQVTVVNEEELTLDQPKSVQQEEDQLQYEDIIQRSVLDFEYPYYEASLTPSYQSVSEIKRLLEDPDNERMASPLQESAVRGLRYTKNEFIEPEFMLQNKPITSAERGTAIHLLMQTIALSSQPTVDAFDHLRQTYIAMGQIREGVVSDLDLNRLADFFKTPLGQKICQNASRVRREQPFSLRLYRHQFIHRYKKESSMEQEQDIKPILVHGIIDGYFIDEQDEVWLYDFKTDHVAYLSDEKQENYMNEKYHVQMQLYQHALSLVLERRIDHVIVVALDSLEIFEMTDLV